jgi:DNA-binding beta-propeller fold protein YncE
MLSPTPLATTWVSSLRRSALPAVLVLLGWVAICPASAFGAVGDLSFDGCIGALTGCAATIPTSAMYGPQSVAVSPDGNSVYVAAGNATAIDTFARNAATGALTFAGCIGDDAGCTPTTPANAVGQVFSVAVSPDGQSVYAASFTTSAIDEFARNTTTGALTFKGCIGDDAGCAATAPADAVDGPRSVTVSPDGRSVYAVTTESQAIDTFSRNPATGALTFNNCIGNDPPGCATTNPPGALDTALSVAVSPDGSSVYVTGSFENVLDAFSRNASTGALTFAGCFGHYAGCTATSPANALEGPVAVTVSADGSSVYVAASQANAVDTLARNTATGALTFSGCTGADAGCTPTTPANALTQVASVAVSPDGQSAYATANGSNAVDVFSRSPASGLLSFANCVGEDAGCTPTTPATALAGPDSVALSADGSNVYALSYGSNAIDELSRQVPPTPSIAAPPTPTPTNSPAPTPLAPIPPPVHTMHTTFGDQQITLTTPSPLTCATTGKTLGVTLGSATIAGSKAARLRFASVALYLDRGIKHTRKRTLRTRAGKEKTVTITSYYPNTTARHLPATLELSIPANLKAGTHTLAAKVSYKETRSKHGHKTIVTLTKTLITKFTVCSPRPDASVSPAPARAKRQ